MGLGEDGGYERAVLELYRAARDDFVAQRKRLALELKAGGDKQAAARLAKLTRPSAAAWAVNQLWWQQRERCEQLFASASRVRRGDAKAANEHRELLTSLRDEAATMLRAAGQPDSEATLRVVSTNLAALAASGGFDPDLPGALSSDREPPGFEAMQGMVAGFAAERARTLELAQWSSRELKVRSDAQSRLERGQHVERVREEQRELERRRVEEQRQLEEQRRLAIERAEIERKEKERARRAEIRRRLGRERETASRERDGCARRVERLRDELVSAESQLAKAEARLHDVDAKIADCGDEGP